MASYNDKVAKFVLENAPYNSKYTLHQIQKRSSIFSQVRWESIFMKKLGIQSFELWLMKLVMNPKESRWHLFLDLLIKLVSYKSVSLILYMLETLPHWLLRKNYMLFFLDIVWMFLILMVKDIMVLATWEEIIESITDIICKWLPICILYPLLFSSIITCIGCCI